VVVLLLEAGFVHVAVGVLLATIFVQRVLSEPAWADQLTGDDRRGLTPLFWSNINPYGIFRLDMDQRLDLDRGPLVAQA